MLKLTILILLIVIVAVPIAAGQILPWWGTLLVLLVEVVLLASMGPRLIAFVIKYYLLGLFKTKSSVLRGAQVEIHAVKHTEKPARQTGEDRQDTDEEEDKGPTRHVMVDCTIRPKAGVSAMQFYDPAELMLVPFDAVPSMNENSATEELSTCVIRLRQVNDAGEESEVPEKLTGMARLRITFAVPSEFSGRAKMRYYFEEFGDLVLP